MSAMFEGFERRRIDIGGSVDLAVVAGGRGPALLLLHGYPQTHVMWHRVAPKLREKFFVVIPDLRGYGDSSGPKPDEAAEAYSKRTMAEDMVTLMRKLGFDSFHVAGHDRGARVAYRLTLDHPERVKRLAVLDIVPTLEAWEAMDWKRAQSTYHWSFLSVPGGVPEKLIGHEPDFYIEHLLNRWAGRRAALSDSAVERYKAAFRKPSVIAASCADYRAGATIDMDHDRADRDAGKQIACPTLLIWARGYLSRASSSPAEVWARWTTDLTEIALDCGHFVAEEEPEACTKALLDFFTKEPKEDESAEDDSAKTDETDAEK